MKLSNVLNWGGVTVAGLITFLTQVAQCPTIDPHTATILTGISLIISAIGGQKNKPKEMPKIIDETEEEEQGV